MREPGTFSSNIAGNESINAGVFAFRSAVVPLAAGVVGNSSILFPPTKTSILPIAVPLVTTVSFPLPHILSQSEHLRSLW